MLTIVETKINEEDCTALELCAAFLKQQMGEDAKVPEEEESLVFRMLVLNNF